MSERPPLRHAWGESHRPIPRRVLRPLQTFMRTESAGGIALLAAAALALVWANSPWSDHYTDFLHTELTIGLGRWSITEDLQHWINDGLMAVFFFVVGLEIKRELVTGELKDPRAAALPVFGALGGMVVPALLYFAINPSGLESRGWGIPMATDIAFALGVLALVAKGMPSSAKLFLLALAIVDDLGAIVVIAIFYSEGIELSALGVAAGLLVAIAILRGLQVRTMVAYVPLGIGVWVAMLESGVHATIAGVALGFLTPARPFQEPGAVSAEAVKIADETSDAPVSADSDAAQWLRLAQISREAVSPLARLEHLLHPYTSFLVIPVFALANAGISLGRDDISQALSSRVTLGIVLGLVVGKALGIFSFAWLATTLGVARRPVGVRWSDVFGVAIIGGIGFTVSLFVTALAFDDAVLRADATMGVLAASLVAALAGAAFLRLSRRRPVSPES